jgi:hypothetical protein
MTPFILGKFVCHCLRTTIRLFDRIKHCSLESVRVTRGGKQCRTHASRSHLHREQWHTILSGIIAAFFIVPSSDAATLLLKDGRTLEGRYVEVTSVAESPLSPKVQAGEVAVTPLILVDDGLRRTFIHFNQIRQVLEQDSGRDVRINIWQQVAERGGAVGRIGRAQRVTPFDEYGRRIYEMQSNVGLLSVVQGITQITPLYTKVEGLMGGARPIVWDSRISTSSIPRETLSRILKTSVRQDDLDGRLQVVSLYLQSERYRDAGAELEQIVKDFPDRKDLEQEIRQLRQLGARLILQEIQLRSAAGQHKLAQELLQQFPSEGVSGETLQEVRELLTQYGAEDGQRKTSIDALNAQIAKINDPNGRRLAEEFAKEIEGEVNEDAIKRLASFDRLVDDAAMTPDQKVALAISGWLCGSNQATDNFQVAVSLATVRDFVRAYLHEPLGPNRLQLASELRDMEGATVERVAQILKLMKPPLVVPKEAERGPRLYEFEVAGLTDESDLQYFVQLPPEYDPLRHYPTIVTLADADVSPEQMLDFWAGPQVAEKGGERLGQATRHGYIVIAVNWRLPHQFTYDYSAREHHAVLGAVRDACRRIGGDAAWDIAVAHPDIWAGVIPICGVADRYVGRYAKNAPYVAWYVIGGELDGDKMSRNARELDRYLKPNTDATVVEYLGRGYEPFGDEIQRVFDWMGRRRRTMPKEIEYATMRPWDSFFWWLEVEGLPEKSMVSPSNWPPPRNARPFQIEGKILSNNRLHVTARVEKATVWLSPELVDFNQQMIVEVNNRAIQPRDRFVRPDLNVLLEDARTRADRQHPFWAKLETK